MARQGIPLIYGGGRIGLMGIVADAALAAGGKVIGIMPRALFAREIAHPGLTELQLVESMHDRKLRMSEQAEGFIALPRGAGALEEFFEQWTWAQLGIHRKPCGLLNVEGYFDPLLAMIERMVADHFLHVDYAEMLLIDRDAEGLLRRFGGCREIREELGIAIEPADAEYLGCFHAVAANEPDHLVKAEIFHLRVTAELRPGAEIEEARWIGLGEAPALTLAPLTRDHVLPLAASLMMPL
jgi:uncharacterized protein (TIGR00730 family)